MLTPALFGSAVASLPVQPRMHVRFDIIDASADFAILRSYSLKPELP